MKPEEVISQLDNLKRYCQYEIGKGDEITRKDVQALDKAIEALEKEIPENPRIEKKTLNIERYGEYCEPEEYLVKKCRTCGSDVEFSYLYCPYCGQKLDWEV